MEMKEYIREFTLKDIISVRNPRVVAIGGGTGLPNILRGIKKYTEQLTAVVTVGDDGGSSGRLREELGILPPGDIRNCILALADDESIMQTLFNFRFDKSAGDLQGHNFGNIFLAAMNGISVDFFDAVRHTSSVLQIKGKVLPVTLQDMVIMGTLKNGNAVEGESHIPKAALSEDSPIDRIRLKHGRVSPLEETIEDIKLADIIIIGPGSLYTSIIPNLLVDGIEQAILDNRGMKIFVENIMTQPGETDHFTAADHVKVLEKHMRNKDRQLFKYIFMNETSLPEEVENRYRSFGSELVLPGEELADYRYVSDDFSMVENGRIRHNADVIARRIFETYLDNRV